MLCLDDARQFLALRPAQGWVPAAARGMEWLSPHEALAFEVHGFVVIEDLVGRDDLAAMNNWIDAHPERRSTRAPEMMLDGRVND